MVDITFISPINEFIVTGSMDDRRMENPGRPFTVTTREKLVAIEKHFGVNPTNSINPSSSSPWHERTIRSSYFEKALKFPSIQNQYPPKAH